MKKTYKYSGIILLILLLITIIYFYLNRDSDKNIEILNNETIIEEITGSGTEIKDSENILEVKGLDNIGEIETKNEVKRN
ncbi:MAG: hypothetical protein PHS49_01095 [Candidatus Gracilibacteria bacterium]|nr:hypothetical protein [Candidatus Gracilibacteria bacterium]